eukprot:6297399-Prymnesium_polylepis.1
MIVAARLPHRTCDRYPLPLASREPLAVLADPRMRALRQLVDERRARSSQCARDRGIRWHLGLRRPKAHIVGDRG